MTKLISQDKSAKGLYKQIKADLMNSVYKPGQRIVIDQLAERLRVSSTPVREILNRLAAEELVVIVPQMGFFMPLLTETDLRNLYSMQQIFLNWSLQDLAVSYAEDGVDRFLKLPFDVAKLQDDQPISAQRLGDLIGAFFLHMIRQADSRVDRNYFSLPEIGIRRTSYSALWQRLPCEIDFSQVHRSNHGSVCAIYYF
jgi:DNA-binding GntR family transcriptional regulator